MFCCKSCPNIVKTNNFINFQSYFLQKVPTISYLANGDCSPHMSAGLCLTCLCFPPQTMPVAMALLRDVQNLCPKDVLNFILDLIKYNDNRKNKVEA